MDITSLVIYGVTDGVRVLVCKSRYNTVHVAHAAFFPKSSPIGVPHCVCVLQVVLWTGPLRPIG